MAKKSSISDKQLVVALDFGTTFSGYAFSFRHEFEKDPLQICPSNWIGGSRAAVSLKTSSCVLFRPSGEFDTFGFDAEEKYYDLTMDNLHQDWFFFRRFKMLLYNTEKLNRSSEIYDEIGKPMEALKVFSAAIGYLRSHVLRACQQKTSSINESNIHWVLTIPAIWGDVAKKFMREAAEQAGIDGSCLSLALEPEAASLYCKFLPVEKIVGSSGVTCFRSGSKYLVLDAGGGTVDITLHEVLNDGNLRELLSANGGPWGGATVDQSFIDFLKELATEDVVDAFRVKYAADFMDLMMEFEVKKRIIEPKLENRMTFKIPLTLIEEFAEQMGSELRDKIRNMTEFSGKVTLAGTNLRCNAEVAKNLFNKTCTNIVDHTKNVLNQTAAKAADKILMVGGFCESPMLQNAIQKSFPEMKVIIPQDGGLAVLKGAVIFGHTPKTIAARVCRFTYGIKMYREFREGIDPPEKKHIVSGVAKCRGTFHKLAEVGQIISETDNMEGIDLQPASSSDRALTLKVFASPEKDPKFVDDPGSVLLGEVVVDCVDKYGKQTTVHTCLVFGGTELEIRATLKSTGEQTSGKFDFLHQ